MSKKRAVSKASAAIAGTLPGDLRQHSAAALPSAGAGGSLPGGSRQQALEVSLPEGGAGPGAGRWKGNLETVATVLGNRVRWLVLRELGVQGRLPVAWLAMRAGVSSQVMSQHMMVLKKAGMVVPSVGRNYQLHPALMPGPGAEGIDLGYAVIRLPGRV